MNKDEAKCYLEFLSSFVNTLHRCGGLPDLDFYKKMTFEELALILSTNGVRFYYDSEGVLKN